MKTTEKNQARLFRRAARELGCDESEERFDAALKKVAEHKPGARKTLPKTTKRKATS